MNMFLWILQIIAALLYGASGVMKAFMFESASKDVRSFGALPPGVWKSLGILELVCVVALVVPGVLHFHPKLAGAAATALALESLIFIGVHVKYRETTPIILSGVLCLMMAVVAYGRLILLPHF